MAVSPCETFVYGLFGRQRLGFKQIEGVLKYDVSYRQFLINYNPYKEFDLMSPRFYVEATDMLIFTNTTGIMRFDFAK
jgi:hypothetical protein